jgi:hypothetical protein
MVVTLSAALVPLDPILIFGLDLRPGRRDHRVGGPMALALGVHGVLVRHRMLSRLDVNRLTPTPAADGGGNAGDSDQPATPWRCLVTHSIAQFGPSAVAGARWTGSARGLQRDLCSSAAPSVHLIAKPGRRPDRPRARGCAPA